MTTPHDLTLPQLNDLLRRLTILEQLRRAQDEASEQKRLAIKAWNEARDHAARVHLEIVELYGKENAPVWFEALHGPEPKPNEAPV